jgi:ribonuclease Z
MKLFQLSVLMFGVALPFHAPQAQPVVGHPDIRVILLGTGGPELSPDRLGYSTLVEAGGQTLLFDTGRGALQRLYESRVKVTDVTKIFYTHLHNDHVEGLPPLWLTPWFLLGRDKPLEVWGPPGTSRMISGMREMFWFDVSHRVNKFNKAENIEVKTTEIGEGEVYARDGVKVSAFSVWHDDGDPSFGYRIDYKGHSVVLSGDTTYSANLVAKARGADLIVHNVVALSPRLTSAPEMKPVVGKLTTPEQAAQVFKETTPRMAVFSHVVKKDLPGKAGDDSIMKRVRQAGYGGPLAMGHDRMSIEIGTAVRVVQPRSTAGLPDLDRKEAYASE